MLGNAQFYNRSIRKIVVAFGTIFNDIQLQRYTKDGLTKKEIFRVPLSYGAKERYITAITSDPTQARTIGVNVPRMSFELTGMAYDPSRKQQSLLQNFAQNATGGLNAQYVPVPYDFNFSMTIYVRNTEDGTQIVEQILPFFKPDFTVTVDMIAEMDQKYDMPIILNSVNTTTEYEGSMEDGTTRLITWDLDFTVKSFLWPAVKQPNGLIGALNTATGLYGRANTNILIDTQDRNAQQVTVDYANGSNYFTTNETIRVNRERTNEITGKVIYFSNSNNGILIVGDLSQLLQANDVVVGDYTNATYNVTSILISPLKGVAIVTQSVPQNAEPDDEFGFSTTITDFPNTLL
jgi:flagellar basal body rod protein FlgF